MAEIREYPYKIRCRSNKLLRIQPLEEQHIQDLRDLFGSLDDIALALLRANLLDDYYDKRVRRAMQHEDMEFLTGWFDDTLVGCIILDRGRLNWTRHTASVHFFVHPDFRRYRIATILLDEVVPFAESRGVEKLYAKMIPEYKAAIALAKKIGFKREATLKNHVLDKYGRFHDLRYYSIDLSEAHRSMEEMLAGFTPYSG